MHTFSTDRLVRPSHLRHTRTIKIVIKPLDENWAVRERHVLARRRDSMPTYTQALIDSIMDFPRHSASRSSRDFVQD